MKSIVCKKFKSLDSLILEEVPTPTPKEDEILIKVYYSSVTTGDWRIQSQTYPYGMETFGKLYFGFNKPKVGVFGTELSGVVEAIGSKVNTFKVGDEVVATTCANLGCHSEYKCLKETDLVTIKPKNLPFEEAAVLAFGGLTALDFLRDRTSPKEGMSVLINGASGSTGIAAIQIAKHLKCNVDTICSEKNFEFVKSLGAENTYDYKNNGFDLITKKYDVIYDAYGNLTYENAKNHLKNDGKLVLITADLCGHLSSGLINLFSSKKVVTGVASEKKAIFLDLVNMASQGFYKPVVDEIFPAQDIKKAYQKASSRHRKGNLAIDFRTI